MRVTIDRDEDGVCAVSVDGDVFREGTDIFGAITTTANLLLPAGYGAHLTMQLYEAMTSEAVAKTGKEARDG